jgi:hypothetical protein
MVNIYEAATKIIELVLDGPLSGSAHHPLVASDTSDGAAFSAL